MWLFIDLWSADWLVERKQVPENWTTELDKLEKEIEYAKSLLPENIRESHLNGDRMLFFIV